jgi:hypothetical protein
MDLGLCELAVTRWSAGRHIVAQRRVVNEDAALLFSGFSLNAV